MESLWTSFQRALETKGSSWTPLGARNAAVDMCFYDVTAIEPQEWRELLNPMAPLPEGGIVILQPTGSSHKRGAPWLKACDVHDYHHDGFDRIDVVAVAGCGSSVFGSVAFGKTVANALGKPVASVIAGYGTRDLMFEAMSGAAMFFPLNWMMHAADPILHEVMPKGPAPFLSLGVFDFVYANPEAAALHQLLLHNDGHIHTIVGHSKGNFAISSALYALKYSLDDIPANDPDYDAIMTRETDFDVITFGCRTEMPHEFGAKGRHRPRYYQYVGTFDPLGMPGTGIHVAHMDYCTDVAGLKSGESLMIGKMHDMLPWNPLHMPVETILEAYKGGRLPN